MGKKRQSTSDIVILFNIQEVPLIYMQTTYDIFNDLAPPIIVDEFQRNGAHFPSFEYTNSSRIHVRRLIEDWRNEINLLAYFQAYRDASIPRSNNDLGPWQTLVRRNFPKHEIYRYRSILLCACKPDD